MNRLLPERGVRGAEKGTVETLNAIAFSAPSPPCYFTV